MEKFTVEFPNLGLEFDISRGFSVFGFEIYWYGVIIGLAIALGVWLLIRRAPEHNISQDVATDMCLWGIVFAIIGARLYYVLFTPGMLDNGILEIFNLRSGGLAIYGGVIGGLAAIIIVAFIHKVNLLKLLDLVVPYLALGQAIGRWGNFFNQEAFGFSTNSLLSMKSEATVSFIGKLMNDTPVWLEDTFLSTAVGVHPTFLYESIGCLAIFFVLLMVRNGNYKRGILATCYVGLYGILRTWIEGMRTDSLVFMGGAMRVSQVLASVSAVVAIVVFILLICFGRTEVNACDIEAKEGADEETASEETNSLTSDEVEKVKEIEEVEASVKEEVSVEEE